ncbi:DUF4336 domain-containing protein [Methylomarinum vadi]|uniref:DUF4336 domain-containing protein n=1 Tax=Methylomarinum vadi TaxID=438855 RepID=UPI001269825B|nr:DUF4336 domain-containing protein [Methylomarinum vadi]
MAFQQIADNLWIHDGETVRFLGLPYSTRMTVVKLDQQRLWIHSPIGLTPVLQEEIDSIGKVRYLVAPNKLHHLFLSSWQAAYPEAECYAAPGLMAKRPDLAFAKELNASAEAVWKGEIAQTLFSGSPWMQEVVFFHIDSKTLILADLIENFEPSVFNRWQRFVAGLTGIVAPNGKTPVDWRMSFLFGKKQARAALATMLEWQPDNIVIAHGECVFGHGTDFLRRSFSWLE